MPRLILLLVSVLLTTHVFGQSRGTDKPVPAQPVIRVEVPRQAPPVVNLPRSEPTPVWPTVVGLVVGALGTAASVFAAVAAMRAAKATEETVKHMQATSVEQSRPYVVVSLELDPEEHWFELVLKNVGKTPALNVVAVGSAIRTGVERFNIDQSGWPAPIASVAPGQEFRRMIGLDSLFYTKEGWHQDISVEVSYAEKSGSLFRDSLTLSFSAFEGAMYDNKHQRIEHALSDIARHTRIFDFGSSIRDPLFWRIWDSLARSGLQLRLSGDKEATVVTISKEKPEVVSDSKKVVRERKPKSTGPEKARNG